MDIIAILGGLLKNENGVWRTTGFEPDGIGDRLRVVAGAQLYHALSGAHRDAAVIACGGIGTLKHLEGVPVIADVITQELVALGVPAEKIFEERDSGTTYEQLRALQGMAADRRPETLYIVSNDYHLPRVRAMIAAMPELAPLHAFVAAGRLKFYSAEEGSIAHDKARWGPYVAAAYASEDVKQRIAKEREGVKKIESGTYRMKKKIVCIIQARMGSTRLPGKVLLPLLGKPVLLHDIDRVLRAPLVDEVVIATTDKPEDDRIEKTVASYHARVFVYRGSENDVLDRYYQAAKMRNADVVVRITSDCPLIDPGVTNATIKLFLDAGDLDYAANVLGTRTFPRGLDTEVVSFKTLEHVWNIATEREDREHVTTYIRKHPERFKAKSYTNDRDLSFHRWTLDEQSDYRLITAIYEKLYPQKPDFGMSDILKLFDEDPALIAINQEVEQKNPHL